jgi:hypothetical protein
MPAIKVKIRIDPPALETATDFLRMPIHGIHVGLAIKGYQ